MSKFSSFGSWSRMDRRLFLSRAAQLGGMGAVSLLLPSLTSATWADEADAPATQPVTTRSGKLRGKTINGVHSFKGIPYGAPTGGERRFLKAAAPQPWTNVRDAFDWGPYAPQSSRQRGAKQLQFFGVLRPASKLGPSEDCLYLNVWSRGLNDGGKRPVMVWLHGGGYDQGSGGSVGYDGLALAKHHDVVTVSLNHRLNVLGYLYLGDILGTEYADSANVGQQDIVTALQWVHDNIEQFGGDPSRVMIFGQSGGGGKVSMLLNMPSAKGLFSSAIIQSGGGGGGSKEAATRTAEGVLTRLELTKANARDILRVPLDKLIAAGGGSPVTDGKVLLDSANGGKLSENIPVIDGNTRTEQTVYNVDNPNYGQLTEQQLLDNVKALVGEANVAKVIEKYKQRAPKANPFALNQHISADRSGSAGPAGVALRRNENKKAPTWVYRWDWETPVMDLLAPHTMEIPFVFHHIDDCQSMTGPITPAMKELEAATAAAWVAMATNGNPNHKGLPNWPAYTAEDKSVMLFDTPCKVEKDPGAELRAMVVPGAAGAGRGRGRRGT